MDPTSTSVKENIGLQRGVIVGFMAIANLSSATIEAIEKSANIKWAF